MYKRVKMLHHLHLREIGGYIIYAIRELRLRHAAQAPPGLLIPESGHSFGPLETGPAPAERGATRRELPCFAHNDRARGERPASARARRAAGRSVDLLGRSAATGRAP